MRKFLIICLISGLCCGSIFAEGADQNPATPEDNPIRIVHPTENAELPALPSTFVCGSVPAGGELQINGVSVPVHAGGGFLTMVPLTPGQFAIRAQLKLKDVTYQLTRTIFVAEAAPPLPTTPLTIGTVTPLQNVELLPGDDLELSCKGSPGMKGFFTVEGDAKQYPLLESGGTYRGIYRVSDKISYRQAKLKVTLVNSENTEVSGEAEGALSLFRNDAPVMAEVVMPDTVLYAGPAISAFEKAGYWMFPPLGTLLQITGSKGEEYRVRLSGTKTAWVNAGRLKLLPEGTPAAPVPVGNVSVAAVGDSTLIRISVARKIPFKIEPGRGGESLDISLFGTFSNTDRIGMAASGVVKELNWFQDDAETYRLQVHTTPNSWWGYDSRFEGNTLVIELITPPPFTSRRANPLLGLTIAVDAGHGAGGGAIGATEYAEGDANFAQALVLQEKLVEKGVKVIMIRPGDQDIPLGERTKIAWQNRADLLISLHNNSLGYGGNPLIQHGFGVYYYYPMSLPLAQEIHAAYGERFLAGKEFNLPDDGLYYANLALTRAPQMPSVLIESAYMIVPEEEAYLKTAGFRAACAEAIIKGLERYLRRMRRYK
jgi:N-acetylmuramoyl-L-alanine amidase